MKRKIKYIFTGIFLWIIVCPQYAKERNRTVAITIDDLPFVGYGVEAGEMKKQTDPLLAALKTRSVPAVGFANGRGLEISGKPTEKMDILKQWLESGMELGNHGYAHLDFHRASLEEYKKEIARGGEVIGRLMKEHGKKLRYYRHPQNHIGLTRELQEECRRYLKESGYLDVPFTIEVSDYIFASLYARAKRKRDIQTGERIVEAYIEFTREMLTYAEDYSERLFGRIIPQVFLIHANALNAKCLEQILIEFERRGYRFISLENAMADPAYLSKDGYTGPRGPSWLHRWAIGMGKPDGMKEEPDPPIWILDLFQNR